jgi:hypothetical protein
LCNAALLLFTLKRAHSKLKQIKIMNNIDRNALVSETRNEYVQTTEGLRRLGAILEESQSARCPHTTEQDRSMTLNDDSLTVGELMDCRSDLFAEEEGE